MWFCESYSEAGHPRCVHTALPGRHTLTAGYPKSVAAVTLPDTTPVGLRLTDLKTPIRAGLTYPVVFTFARAGELRLRLWVDNPDQPREDCPLPANGRPPQVFTAPIGQAPVPPPGYSSIDEQMPRLIGLSAQIDDKDGTFDKVVLAVSTGQRATAGQHRGKRRRQDPPARLQRPGPARRKPSLRALPSPGLAG